MEKQLIPPFLLINTFFLFFNIFVFDYKFIIIVVYILTVQIDNDLKK